MSDLNKPSPEGTPRALRYIPNTIDDQAAMLAAIGVGSVEELFADVPAAVRLDRPLDLPAARSELELMAEMERLAGRNADLNRYASFLGAGAYDHWVPSVVQHILLRNEFYTAYTPYQPEFSQGLLQSIYEYQTLVSELTGLAVANASMYDGGSAFAEAATLACRATRRSKIVVAQNVHPEYRQVLRTYTQAMGIEISEAPFATSGQLDLAEVERLMDGGTAGLLAQSPNFFGCLEDGRALAELAHRHGALFAVAVDPISLGILEPPGAYGADMAVAEGQALGNHLSFGGPYLGVFAVRENLIRQMPGRLVGRTVDNRGQRGFVLTLATREQHIRREKATSNICTNQALNALAATVYLTLLGPQGIREVAAQCAQRAHYLAGRLSAAGARLAFTAPFFKEFTVRLEADSDGLAALNRALFDRQIIGGLDLGRIDKALPGHYLLAVTERRSREEMDRLAATVADWLGARRSA